MADRFKNRHKITEPSAQIPTFRYSLLSYWSWCLFMSQNNRAFRSNPNLFLGVRNQNFPRRKSFLSQNNRAFRSNPNSNTWWWCPITDLVRCHKITEPSAQIPTKRMGIDLKHKLKLESQNNRAFRSNPNHFFSNGYNNDSLQYNCHKITEPSAQIPTIMSNIVDKIIRATTSQNNRAFRSNPNVGQIFGHFSALILYCHKITEPSAKIPT